MVNAREESTGDDAARNRAPGTHPVRQAPERPSLTVAVLTYRRNAYLAELLPLLLAQAEQIGQEVGARVLVVDNDPRAGATAVVAEAARAAAGAGPGLVCVHEPVPGIVAGRNRALRECGDQDLLVFIDDDELPREGWLRALLAAWREYGCAAVTGPTPPVYEEAPDAWVVASGAFDSWRAADGARVPSADTGNLLLDLAVVRDLALRFDPRYGLSGGEDSLFTRSLTLAGATIRFAAGAVVDKRVPPTRATRAWVLRRSFRSGSSWARVRIDTATGARLPRRLGYALKGLARAGRDGARAVVARGRGDDAARAVHEVSCRGGLGMVVGAFGGRVLEYGRAKDAS